MRRSGLLLPLLLLLFPLAAQEFDLSRAVPGGIIVLSAGDEATLAGGAELRISGRAVSSGSPFRAPDGGFSLLLPVPADPASSVCEIIVGGETREIELGPREFVHEEISLNGAMSSLRQSDDQRKADESRILWELLGEFDPDAGFYEGTLRLPVGPARRSSRYGDRRLFLYRDGSESRALHYGIDFAVGVGTPVAAAGDGLVVMATERMLTGLSLVIRHGPGIYSIYYHLDGFEVVPGEFVTAGSRVATSGVSGLATGAHLHWELRINRVPVDPDLFVAAPFLSSAPPAGEGG